MTPGVLFLLALCLASFAFITGVAIMRDGEDGSTGLPALAMALVLLLVFAAQLFRGLSG